MRLNDHLVSLYVVNLDLNWAVMNGLLEVHFVDCAALQNLFHRCENETYWRRRAVGNVSGKSNCRSRGREFDPSLVPYFCGDWSWNNFYGHSPPFRWIIQEGLLSVTSKSMCRKSVVRWTDCPAMTIAVDLRRKATKQTKWNIMVLGRLIE